MANKIQRFLAGKEFTEGVKKFVADAVLEAETAGLPRAYDSPPTNKPAIVRKSVIPRFNKKPEQ